MNRHDDSVVTADRRRERDGDRGSARGAEQVALWRRILSLAFTIAVVVFTIYLWPAMLGGSARVIVVSGQSMEPTYDLLDIVVTRDAGDTEVGDIVVFKVPEGEAEGMLVIHRVLEVDDEGFFITQGDNRDTPDQWQLTEDDVVGKPLAHIPKGGKALGFIQNIWVIALLVGLVVLFVLWPDEDESDDEVDADLDVGRLRTADETDALERDAAWALIETPATVVVASIAADSWQPLTPWSDLDVSAEAWLDAELSPSVHDTAIDDTAIDDEVMVDAVAWLDQQLAGLEQSVAH